MEKGSYLLAIAAAVALFASCAGTGATTGGASEAENTVSVWNFESGTTEGWHGAGKFEGKCTVNEDPKFVKEGKYSLKIDLKGSKDWNQDGATIEGPFEKDFGQFAGFKLDIFVPGESVAALEWGQIFLVFSGASNGWYQVWQGFKSKWQTITFKMDPAQIEGELWHAFIVFNTGGPMTGPVYVDNIRGIPK